MLSSRYLPVNWRLGIELQLRVDIHKHPFAVESTKQNFILIRIFRYTCRPPGHIHTEIRSGEAGNGWAQIIVSKFERGEFETHCMIVMTTSPVSVTFRGQLKNFRPHTEMEKACLSNELNFFMYSIMNGWQVVYMKRHVELMKNRHSFQVQFTQRAKRNMKIAWKFQANIGWRTVPFYALRTFGTTEKFVWEAGQCLRSMNSAIYLQMSHDLHPPLTVEFIARLLYLS